MLISVCLPTYNGASFIKEAVASVLEQRSVDLELLVSDDCSTDETFEVVRQAAEQDSRIRFWRNDSNLGLFENYNKCISLAQGELIKPFAQDDRFAHSGVLQTMLDLYRASPAAALVAVGRETDGLYAPTGEVVQEKLRDGLNQGKDVISLCLRSYRNLIGEPSCVMFPSQHRTFSFDAKFESLGDLDLWIRLLQRGNLVYEPSNLILFRQHQDSTTMKLLKNMEWISDFYLLARKHQSHLAELGISIDEYCMSFSDLAGGLIDRLVQEGKLNVDDLSGTAAVAYYSLRRCAQLSFKSREYDSVINSTSWRLTQPLRAIMRKKN